MLDHLSATFRYAARGLLARPGFTLVVVLTLGFGIGANVAIYSLFHQLLLRPLPVSQPEQLVNLSSPGPRSGSVSCNDAGPCEYAFSYPMFRDIERLQTPFEGVAAHRIVGVNLAYEGRTLSASGVLVSGSYFGLLGLRPALGRLLGPQDDRVEGEADAVVLGHAYWRNSLGADPGVIGRSLVVNGRPLTVVGVAPEGFGGTTQSSRASVFLPISFRWLEQPGSLPNHDNRRHYWVYAFARLKPGIGMEQAAAAMAPVYGGLIREVELPLQSGMSEQGLARFAEKPLLIEPGLRGQSRVPDEAGTPLSILLAVTGLVLLIACVNIANLMLARGASRAGELALRASLGASRWRLTGQLLAECLLLAALAGLVSLPLALATLKAVVSLLPANAGDILGVALDVRAVVVAMAVAFGSVFIFGLFPALRAARAQPADALKSQSARGTGSKSANRFRSVLATAQVAFSMALLVLAGLFAQSLVNISRVELGIRVDSLSAFAVAPELNGYRPEASAQLFDRIEAGLAALPGVSAVSSSMVPLLSGSDWSNNVSVEGFDAGPDTNTNSVMNYIGTDYFRTLGMTLVAGRDFTEADGPDAPRVAIVNRRFAERFDLGNEAVGKRMAIGAGGDLDIEIVGVVQDAKYNQVKDAVGPQFFLPRRQSATLGSMTFYVHSALPPEQVLAAIPGVVSGLDPNLPVNDLRSMRQQVRDNVMLDRFVGTLAAAFAALATLLAALGLYGVLSYTVAQRTREIGLRLALGAPPARLRGMVLGQMGRMAIVGGALGLLGALALGQGAGALLYGMGSTSPGVILGATLALGLVVLAAGYLPARRAGRIDPMLALRNE